MGYLAFMGWDGKLASHSLALLKICQQCSDDWQASLVGCKWFSSRFHKDSANCPQMDLVFGDKGCQ